MKWTLHLKRAAFNCSSPQRLACSQSLPPVRPKMKISKGVSIKGVLAALAVLSLATLIIEYYKLKASKIGMWQSLTYTDLISFAIGFIGRPIIRQFFRLDESFWNTSREVAGLHGSIRIGRDAKGVPFIYGSHRDDLCFGQGFLHGAGEHRFHSYFTTVLFSSSSSSSSSNSSSNSSCYCCRFDERPFQMELLRLLATGKAASVLGKGMADTDMITRQKLLMVPRTVISEEAMLWKLRRVKPDALAFAVWFVHAFAGVTEALGTLPRRPIEFVLLGHSPSLPFSLLDIAAVNALYSIMLNRGLTGDFVRVYLKETLGDKWKLFNFGYPEDVPPLNAEGNRPSLYDLAGKPVGFPSVDLDSDEWARRVPSAFPELIEKPLSYNPEFGAGLHDRNPSPEITRDRMRQFWLELEKAEDFDDLKHPKPWQKRFKSSDPNHLHFQIGGSNAWAVSGKFTKSGMPILAGDPHLEVNAPGFWMPMGLKSDGTLDGVPLRAIGASAVAATGLFVGHNEHAAWTQTVTHSDVDDLMLLELDEEGTQYFYDGKKYPLKFIEHYIHGESAPVRHLARYSHHGPLFSDAIPPLRKRIKKNQALVLASVALRAPMPAEWPAKMLYGKNWKDYIEMGQYAQANEFVCVWATKEGFIGASVSGAVPLRPTPPEATFRSASDSTQDWKGVLPQNEVPFVMNPKSGVIVAGNSVLAKDPKRIFGEVFVPGHRVRRAHQLLADLKKKKVEVDDLVKMQVFDLSDWNKSKWAFFPGVSGWVGSPNFDNTAALLEDGKETMMPMPWDEDEIEASLVSSMTISPKAEKQQQQQQQRKQEL
ncbi:hypothetical protein Esti_003453 [Eimeria stiedai]